MKRIILALLMSLTIMVANASNNPGYKSYRLHPKNCKIISKGTAKGTFNGKVREVSYIVMFENNGGNGQDQVWVEPLSSETDTHWWKLTLSINTYCYEGAFGFPHPRGCGCWHWVYLNWTGEIPPNEYDGQTDWQLTGGQQFHLLGGTSYGTTQVDPSSINFVSFMSE